MTETGKSLEMDAFPVEDGTHWLLPAAPGGQPEAKRVQSTDFVPRAKQARYTLHSATCLYRERTRHAGRHWGQKESDS